MSIIDQIKERLDLVDYIGKQITLKKSGTSYVALCPFHTEKTPSFHVFPDSQRYKCFGGCDASGDLLDFYQKKNNVDAPEAIRALAALAGIEIVQAQDRFENLHQALGQAIAYYHDCLRRGSNKAIFEYLRDKRGIEVETLKSWQIGYAPDNWSSLVDYMIGKGWSEGDLLRAGLVGRSQKSDRLYDRFRDRIMIPIYDAEGHPVGFGGRAFSSTTAAKYLNTPQTPIFDKGGLLFGLNRAKSAIREQGAILVEGYLDVIQAHQAGFTNAVASMGTSFSEGQGKLLTRYNQKMIIALDGDTAGGNAALRNMYVAANMALADRLTLDIRLAIMPPGEDPDSLIRSNVDQWREIIGSAKGAADHMIGLAVASLPPSPTLHDKERAAREVLPVLTATERDLSRAANIQMLALALGVPERALVEWAEQQGTPDAKPEAQVATSKPTLSPLERLFMIMLLRKPMELAHINVLFRDHELEQISASDFSQPVYRTMFELLQKALHQDAEEYTDFVRARLPGEFVAELDAMASASGDPANLKHCAMNVRRESLQRRNRELAALEGHYDELQANMRGIFVLSGLLRARQVC